MDITEEKQREAERLKLEKQFRQAQKLEAIGRLAGGIAHDFNNILSSIIGFTELTLECVDNKSIIHDNLKEVWGAGIRARDLVKQILMFSREEELELKPVQLKLVAEEVCRLLRRRKRHHI